MVQLAEKMKRLNNSTNLWIAAGIILAGLLVGAGVCLSRVYSREAVIFGIMLISTAGVVYLFAVFKLSQTTYSHSIIFWIAAVGIFIRIVVWCYPHEFSNDYFRYLWDGGVTASGINPYKYSPAQVYYAKIPPKMKTLADKAGLVFANINHPFLRTVYPPVAQGIFALAYWIKPFSISSWRVVLLLFDISSTAMIILILRKNRLPLTWLAAYLWNPLLVVETYCGVHLDIIVGTFLLLFIYLLLEKRLIPAVLALSAAVGSKLWPVIMIFFVVFSTKLRKVIVPVILFLVLASILIIPLSSNLSSHNSGVAAYAKTWRANAGLFRLLEWLFDAPKHQLRPRIAVMILLLSFTCWRAIRARNILDSLCSEAGLVIFFMLLITPTLYPWYYIPLIPLAALTRKKYLLIWTTILPACYLTINVIPEWICMLIIHIPGWFLLSLSIWTLHHEMKGNSSNALGTQNSCYHPCPE